MWRTLSFSIVMLFTLGWTATPRAIAFQDKSLVYVIRFAAVSPPGLEVHFGNNIPPDGALQDPTNWLITTIDLQTGVETRLQPSSVTVNHILGVIAALAVTP